MKKIGKKRNKARIFVTVIISALIALFIAGIFFSYTKKQNGQTAQNQTARQGQNSGQTGQNRAQSGNQTAQQGQVGGQARQNQGQGGQGGGNRNAIAVRVSKVALRDIAKKIIVNGDVLAGREVSIFPNVAGRLSELRLKIGDTAARGQVVALVDPSKPGEIFSQSPVVSPISGTILSSPVSAGNTVSASTAVYTIGDLSNLLVETFVPERFAGAIRKGLSAEVSFEAIEGETFGAVVDEISPVLDPASRTLRIRLKFPKKDPRIRVGMFAQISLITNSRAGVKSIPRDALINTYGSYLVFILDDKGVARRREVELGLESETLVEILNGLETGETVVIAGQNFLTDGDPARAVE